MIATRLPLASPPRHGPRCGPRRGRSSRVDLSRLACVSFARVTAPRATLTVEAGRPLSGPSPRAVVKFRENAPSWVNRHSTTVEMGTSSVMGDAMRSSQMVVYM